MGRVSEKSLGTEVPAGGEEGQALTTIEREVPEQREASEHRSPRPEITAFESTTVDTTAVDTAAADDAEFEPTIIRGRE